MAEYKLLLIAPEHLRPVVGAISFERTIEVSEGGLGDAAVAYSVAAANLWDNVQTALEDQGHDIPVPAKFATLNEYRGYGSSGSSGGKKYSGGGKSGSPSGKGLSKRQYARTAEALEEMHSGDAKWQEIDNSADQNPVSCYLFGFGGAPEKYASKFPNPFNGGSEGIYLSRNHAAAADADSPETDAFVAWLRNLAGLELTEMEQDLLDEHDILSSGPATSAAQSAANNRAGVQKEQAEMPFSL